MPLFYHVQLSGNMTALNAFDWPLFQLGWFAIKIYHSRFKETSTGVNIIGLSFSYCVRLLAIHYCLVL